MAKKRAVLTGILLSFSFMGYSMERDTGKNETSTVSFKHDGEVRVPITPVAAGSASAQKKPVPNLHISAMTDGSDDKKLKAGGASSAERAKAHKVVEDLRSQVQRTRSEHRQNTARVGTPPAFGRRKSLAERGREDAAPKRRAALDSQDQDIVFDTSESKNIPTRRRFHSSDPSSDLPAATPRKKSSFLPKAIVQDIVGRKDLPGAEVSYTEEEVWAMLEVFNRKLYDFGKQHKMDLDQVREYSVLFQGVEVTPEGIVSFLKTHNEEIEEIGKGSLPYIQNLIAMIPIGETSDDALIKRYQNIKKKNPTQYEALALNLLKGICDEEDGCDTSSPLMKTHIGVQNAKIADQESQTKQAWGTSIVGWATAIGTAVVAAYVSLKPTSCPIPPVCNCTNSTS